MINIHHGELRHLQDPQRRKLLHLWNQQLESIPAPERIEWALRQISHKAVLTSSFGIQSAVLLHMVATVKPDIPVVFIDSGYLFPETYQFADRLIELLDLDVKVFQPRISPAWQESKYGRLWERGIQGIDQYNSINKIEPITRALKELAAELWIAGPRREQANSRRELAILEQSRFQLPKLHPIVDWSHRQVHRYLTAHQLPVHPLWEQGYVSVGDVHSTVPLSEGMVEEQTRFAGLKRECGLHR